MFENKIVDIAGILAEQLKLKTEESSATLKETARKLLRTENSLRSAEAMDDQLRANLDHHVATLEKRDERIAELTKEDDKVRGHKIDADMKLAGVQEKAKRDIASLTKELSCLREAVDSSGTAATRRSITQKFNRRMKK